MKRFMTAMTMYVILLTLVSFSWQAQDAGKSDVDVIIPYVVQLSILESQGFFVDLGASTTGEDLQRKDVAKMKVWTNAPQGWTVHVWTNDEDLGPFEKTLPPTRKAIEDFSWKSSTGQEGVLTNHRQVFAQGGPLEEYFISSDYFVDIKATDPPGDYGVTLNYVVEINDPNTSAEF